MKDSVVLKQKFLVDVAPFELVMPFFSVLVQYQTFSMVVKQMHVDSLRAVVLLEVLLEAIF